MKRTIAFALCCSVILVSGNEQSNNGSTAIHKDASTESTMKPNFSNTSKPSTSVKTSTTVTETNNTSIDTTKATKPIARIITLPQLDPKPYKWFLNGTNSSIIVQLAAKINVLYYNSTSKKNSSVDIVIPANNQTLVNGSFDQYDEIFTLSWNSTGEEKNYVLFHFKRFMNSYVLNNLEVSLNLTYIPDYSNSTLKLVHKHEHFNTTIGNSYRCMRLQTFNLTRENDTIVVGFIKVSDLQYQAFKADRKSVFGYAEDCLSDTPDSVPIVVGCILSGLIIIILVAYLIARRRSESRGYLSM